ncbi:threonine aldolase, partial [bacterium SM23_31]
DVFGEDPTVNLLQEKAASLFKMEAALFMPSGTMANEVAVKTHTQPGDEVITDDRSHIFHFESGAAGLLSGVNIFTLPGKNGIITAEQIKRAIRPDGIQYAESRLISLENTHNYGGGSIFPLPEIEKIASLAREHNIRMHLDGARIFNAVVASGIAQYKYAQYFDSAAFCLSKGLGAPVGSVLLGTAEFIDRARKYRKIFGGGMRQVGILAAAGIYALDNNINRLAEDHKNAKSLAVALNESKTFEINPDEIKTNIIIAGISGTNFSADRAAAKLAECGILVFPFGYNSIRAVTHLDVTSEDIAEACDRIAAYF